MSPITVQEESIPRSLREPGSSNSPRGPKPLIKPEYADWIGTIAVDNYTKRNALSAELIAEVMWPLIVSRHKARVPSSCVPPAMRGFGRQARPTAQGENRPVAIQ